MSVIDRLQTVFRQTFHDETIVIAPETTAEDIEAWDSLSHVGLIMAVEKAFGIRFNATEIASLENVGALAEVIRQRAGAA
jgi:acyl carrier protein